MQHRELKEGSNFATVNDWAGRVEKGKLRIATNPSTGEPLLDLRDTMSPWQTVDGELSTLLGSGLCEEQVRLHKSYGHTQATAEKETKRDASFYCLCHLDGQCFPRGKDSRRNGACEGVATRVDIDNVPPPLSPW
jgi:hypothetical protein